MIGCEKIIFLLMIGAPTCTDVILGKQQCISAIRRAQCNRLRKLFVQHSQSWMLALMGSLEEENW